MITEIRSEAADVHARLAVLGLNEQILHKAISQGLLARSETTKNHPPLYAGFVTWANIVRSLREELIPLGWSRNDDKNYSRVFNSSRTMAIAVATGDENTGNRNVNPMTKSPKGAATSKAVEFNAAQMSLFAFEIDQIDLADEENSDLQTWLLLFTRVKGEMRCELSLPITCNGKVDGWSERLLLSAIPIDPTTIDTPAPKLPDMPDIEVAISRRA
jgi:hypothetical protein